ncbi:MAG: UvrD-helicase domain-containing protein [Gammaproteobacteria bacterium]|nr:UvrD-helicase domain-containing protein [Gammaproteobacteria bacterium]MCY4227261.1 UvrD-helicase domain-containing protein [Gammaproteobacteria bacterium]
MNPPVEIEDGDVRQEVLDPARSFIVQAPAGSGKTELLIRRYLCLLLVVNQPEEIVAITFTRKAAAEMRERILHSLESAEQDPDGRKNKDLRAKERWQIARNVLRRSDDLGWRLTTNPARTRIQTIDSFCGRLVKQMPVLSRLGGHPEILEDARPLYQEAAEQVLKILNQDADAAKGTSDDRHLSESLAILLGHLDNYLPRIRDLIATMLAKRDQWQDYVFEMQSAKENPNIDLRAILESKVENHIESILERARVMIPGECGSEFCSIMNYALANLGVIMPNQFLDDLLEENAGGLELWREVARVCLTNSGTWRSRLTVKEGFPPGSDDAGFKQRFEELLQKFAQVDPLQECFQQIQRLPEPCYTPEEWSVLEVLPELLRRAYAELRLLFRERNQVDFVEVSTAANNALGGEDDPTDLALYLDHRIQHILIDEYQDSSKGQRRLLEKLTAGWTDADGHSLFLVGDPMQSIYRFRDAEVGLFLKTWHEQRLGQISVHHRRITMNFRSDKALVTWVNGAFPEVFPAESNSHMGAVKFTPAVAFQPHAEECGVKLHAAVGGEMDEAQQVVDLIRKTKASYPKDKIAILVRSRNHLRRIVPALIQSNTSFRAVDIEKLAADPAIQDLIALTRALHHEADRVAWLAVLRAPWCGLTLEDLFQLAGEKNAQTLWHCMWENSLVENLSQDGQKRLLRVRAVIKEAFELEGRVSLRRWIEGAWINLGGPATMKHEGDLANAETFFCVLDEMDEGGYIRDRKAFFERIDALYAGADTRSDDTLQIMTIHKAKGLEFDHVILPGLGAGGGRSPEQLFLWSDTPDGLLVAPIKRSGQETTSRIYEFIQDYEKRRREYEESRLLYVALTRARKNMHLMMSFKGSKPPQGSMLAKLWSSVGEEHENLVKNRQTDVPNQEEVQSEDEPVKSISRLKAEWYLPQPPSPVAWTPSYLFDHGERDDFKAIKFKWAGQTIKQVGTIVHRCLQQIATEGSERWDADRIEKWQGYFRDSLRSVGVAREDLEEAVELVRSALTQTLQDPRGQWIVSSEHKDAKCEFALSGVHQDNLVNIVIDRTFVDENGIRWIVDYKTSRRESGGVEEFLDDQVERYRSQLERYGDIMSSFDDRPIRAGLYFPLLKGWREWSIRN